MINTLVLIYFGRPQLDHTIKTSFITFQTIDLENFEFFYEKVWDYLLHHIFV